MKTIPVAITGLGLVSPLGLSVEESLDNAIAGRSGIRRYTPTLAPEGTQSVRVGGTVEGFDHSRYGDPKFPIQYDSSAGFALNAVEQALRDSGLGGKQELGDRFGCVIGSALPGADVWHRSLDLVYAQKKPTEMPNLTGFTTTITMVNSMITLKHKLRGPSITTNNACSASAAAMTLAADQIRLGRADAMIAGGYEASMRTWLVYGSFVATKGMNSTEDPERASRPFSKDRAGFVLSEGAGMVVLERLDLARARGARIYGILAGDSNTNDAHHIISPDPTGGAWARAMKLAIESAEVLPRDIDVVSAHATGTIQGDIAETRAIKQVFGGHVRDVAVSATKSMHGHGFGAGAAFETILAIGAMQRDTILPTINFQGGDPECDLDYVPNQARTHKVRTILKNSFGAGGVTSCLVIKRYEGRK